MTKNVGKFGEKENFPQWGELFAQFEKNILMLRKMGILSGLFLLILYDFC